MDDEIRRRVREAVRYLQEVAVEDIDFDNMDPIVKMMLVAVLHEGQKLRDDIASIPQRVIERYCSDFVPYEKVGAMPAIAILQPTFKSRTTSDIVTVSNGASFLFKKKESRQQLNYLPVFETMLLPHADMFVLSCNRLKSREGLIPVSVQPKNRVWVGIVTDVEIDSLQGLSVFIKGTKGILPEHIYVVAENRNATVRELEIATMQEVENMNILEPFDAQQASGQVFSFFEKWKECLLNMDDAAMLYVTDKVVDRDLFKPHPFPKSFGQWLENEILEQFQPNTLWLQLDFPEGYVIPDSMDVAINVLPVVNVDVNSVTLTQTVPIAKLQKQDNSFFLRVLETSTASHRQGFSMSSEEVIIRDFDASRYHNGDLYRDVRTLFNRFLDDYYAFIEYNGIKDGESLKNLRGIINKLSKDVGDVNDKFRFDSGTYVMRNISQENQSSSTKVSFMTTFGEAGNLPKEGETMDNRRVPGINQKVDILVSAMGGADKASVDARYELLRYYALTNDRLYTRMDVDAFLRKEIMLAFGREEYHRIAVRINIEGAGGNRALRRGLYIDLEFKDKKNYEKALQLNFGVLMQQRIANLSCISMPIIVSLKNLEE
ncbi:MAG: hypothetical protein IJE15_10670 [Bacteroidaceae bacterium]|nr:hypothetical protein [Bacteroidaceae bacterium]